MRHLGLGLSLVVFPLCLFPVTLASSPRVGAATYQVDAAHSSVVFRVKHMGVSNFYGRFNDISGKLVIDEENAADSSVDIEIKIDSIDTNSADRDKHLKSPDFFNARQFPVATFESEKVEQKGDVYEVTGTLQLHGVEKTVTITMTKVGEAEGQMGHRIGFEGTLDFKRLDYGINYSPDALGNDIHLILSIEAVRK